MTYIRNIIKWIGGSKSLKCVRSSETGRELTYGTLEQRQLLAADFSFDSGTGVVTIQGSSADDEAFVNIVNNGTQANFTIIGGGNHLLDLSVINSITFVGGAGNDRFENYTAIDSLMQGHAGIDTFQGGSGVDLIYGGPGADILSGGDGNDRLFGGDGEDNISGEFGDDTIYGGNDDDLIDGGHGEDHLNGDWANDTVFGGDGDDYITGFSGNDNLFGGDGADTIYGQAGDDELLGDAGNDRIRGNNGEDYAEGNEGHDYINGDAGVGFLYGGSGDDTIIGFNDNDEIDGGFGNDLLYAQGGDDIVRGGDGVDRIRGGDGNDLLYGDEGIDHIFGDNDDDRLFGGEGADNLYGGNGNDGLHGGSFQSVDKLTGGAGGDRFLIQNNDNTLDRTSEDVGLIFEDFDDGWLDLEIEVIDNGLNQLHAETGNTVLMKETLNTDDLTFFKYASLGGAAGINYLETTTHQTWNGSGWDTTYSYYREIRFADWDETSEFMNNFFASVAIHEVAHNWDSATEMESVSALLTGAWDTFLALSQWTDTDPNDSDFIQSTDGNWWYHNSAAFAEDYGKTNPNEDFATMWEFYFSGQTTSDPALQAKFDAIESVMDELSS